MPHFFGTDGIRGIANEELTPEMALKLGQACATVFGADQKHPVFIVGRDTRASGELLSSALCSGIASAGGEVWDLGIAPTPAVAWLASQLKVSAAVVISASHNPAEYNGIKVIGGDGYKLAEEKEDLIEEFLLGQREPKRVKSLEIGRIYDRSALLDKYFDYLLQIAEGLSLKEYKIVVDGANGAASHLAPRLLRALSAEVDAVNCTPDGFNINQDCGSTHLEALAKRVKARGADLGLAYDGDADRLLAVDEKGEVFDGDNIIFSCAKILKKEGRLKNNLVVVTIMSNYGLFEALAKEEIKVLTTKVGDRYVMEELRKNGAVLGGEQSGHIIFLDRSVTGDGLITSLELLRIVADQKRPLSSLAAEMRRYPQVLINIPLKEKNGWENDLKLKEAIAEAENVLQRHGRVVVRPSGTEPLLRILLEGPDKEELNNLAKRLKDKIGF